MSLPHIAKAALAVAGASLLAGCLPIPHHDAVSPAVDGTLHRNGRPVAGAQLYVENTEDCTFPGAPLAQSDADGAFRIPLRQRMGYFMTMDPGRGPAWRLCIADGGRRYTGWYEAALMHYGRLALDCNLESAPQKWGWRGYYGALYMAGVCRSRADEAQGELMPLPPASTGK